MPNQECGKCFGTGLFQGKVTCDTCRGRGLVEVPYFDDIIGVSADDETDEANVDIVEEEETNTVTEGTEEKPWYKKFI